MVLLIILSRDTGHTPKPKMEPRRNSWRNQTSLLTSNYSATTPATRSHRYVSSSTGCVRPPFGMPGPASIISSLAISGSNCYNYHPCIVVGSLLGGKVYVCRSYSDELDLVSYVSSLAHRLQLAPPPPYHPYTTPGFGVQEHPLTQARLAGYRLCHCRHGWEFSSKLFFTLG